MLTDNAWRFFDSRCFQQISNLSREDDIVKDKQYEMDVAIKALKAAAHGISAAVDSEAITGDQVYALLTTIAKQMDAINQPDETTQ